MPFSILDYIWLVPALPLLAFAVNGLFGRMLKKTAGIIGCVLVCLTFLLALWVLVEMINRPAESGAFQYNLYTWIPSGDFHVNIAFLVDQLTAFIINSADINMTSTLRRVSTPMKPMQNNIALTIRKKLSGTPVVCDTVDIVCACMAPPVLMRET